MMKQQQMSSFGRLTHSAWLILLSLQDHPMDGRELLTSLEEGKHWLEPGTLWATLSRLERAGLISPLELDGLRQPSRRYDVTDTGLSVLSQEWNKSLQAEGRIGLRSSRGVVHGWIMVLIKWIVRLYPKAWRTRYEQEMLELLSEHEITLKTWLDLFFNVISVRLDPYYQGAAPLEVPQRERRVQWTILAAFILPLLSALFYLFYFLQVPTDYWTRNEVYPVLALIHQIGSNGVNVTIFVTSLTFTLLAYEGIRKFGRPGDVHLRRLVLVMMFLPILTSVLVVVFGPPSSEAIGATMFGLPLSEMASVAMLALSNLAVLFWGVVRRKEFKRAFLYLLPLLGINLCVFTMMLGALLFPPLGTDNGPPFYMPLALLCLLSVPFSFAFAMARLHLERRTRTILLTLTTTGTLGMMLVQLMMVARLIIIQYLGLGMSWTPEFIFLLIMNVLATVLALVLLLSLLFKRREKVSRPG